MKKILIISIFLFINNCGGYEPIFSSKDISFYINKIYTNDNIISHKIKRKLKPYTNISRDKELIDIEIFSDKKINIISKDTKGDASAYEMIIISNIKIISEIKDNKEFSFIEKFTFNTQSNKFEFTQYKKNIESDLVEKIYQDLIINLRTF